MLLGTSVIPGIRGFTNKGITNLPPIHNFENEEKCYGFAVPLIQGERLPITSIQQGIANVINDCLRMNVSVYWAASNLTILGKEGGTNITEAHTFMQGTFIIPLTGNLSKDILITTIMFNYGFHSEIEQYYPVQYYHLMEPINILAYHLNMPRIIYYLGDEIVWDWLVFHYDAVQQAGFLNIDFFLDGDTTTNLTTNHYNVFVCVRRGVGQGIPPIIKSALDLQRNSALRSFVQGGGGYIGIKYGAVVASAGPSILLGFLKSLLKKPLYITGLSLTNTSYTVGSYNCMLTLEIVNTSSPIVFGLNRTIRTLFDGGPIITWAGRNAQPYAIIQDASLLNPAQQPSVFARWKSRVIGKPLWVTSEFGKGKVVTYGDDLSLHYPERNDRVFHNSFFYVTSDNKQQMNSKEFQSFSTIESIYMIAATITLAPGVTSYQKVRDEVASLQNISSRINSIEEQVDILLYEMQEERKWGIKIHMLPTIDPRNGQIRLRDLYYDTFTRFLDGLSHAITSLEAITSTMNGSNITIQPLIKEWEDHMLSYLDDVKTNATQILSFDQWFTQKLQAFTLKNSEEFKLLKEYNQYDRNIKRCYKFLSRAWLETIQLYRILWYDYETEMISGIINNNSGMKPIDFMGTNHDFTALTTGMIYVNDDGLPGGNGSLARPYHSIQDGIEAASTSDSVFVFAGTYHEHPVVSKSLRIIGENKFTTVIDGDGKPRHVVWITADNVTFRGFTVTNCSKKYCGGIVFYSSYNNITDNIVSHGDTGISLGGLSHDNVISDNIIENNTYCGIGIDATYHDNNEISSNIIRNNGYCGLFLCDSNNSVHNNTFENNGILIYPPLYPSSQLIIYNNTLNEHPLLYFENKEDMVFPNDAAQIIVSACSNCSISNITLTYTNPAIEILSSRNIRIENSTFSYNKIGIWVYNSSKLIILKNIFYNNSWSGLWLYQSNQNEMINNSFEKNDDGILVFRSIANGFSNNTFSDNMGGLSCWSTSDSNKIMRNNFIKNHEQAYDQGIDQWAGNYWDDWIGIQHSILRFIPYHLPGGIDVDWHPVTKPYDCS